MSTLSCSRRFELSSRLPSSMETYRPPGAKALLHASLSLEGLQSADGVEHEGVPGPGWWCIDVGVVQDLIRAQRPDEVDVPRAADGGDTCPERLGELDRERPGRARRTVDENVISGLDPALVDVLECEEAAVCGSGGLLVAEVVRLERQAPVHARV